MEAEKRVLVKPISDTLIAAEQEIGKILSSNESVVSLTQKSVKRIQKIFGERRSIPTQEFINLINWDLQQTLSQQDTRILAVSIVALLDTTEIWLFSTLDKDDWRDTNAEEEMRYKSISDTLWKHWSFDTNDGSPIANQLVRHVGGNLKYYKLSTFRDNKNNQTDFDNDRNPFIAPKNNDGEDIDIDFLIEETGLSKEEIEELLVKYDTNTKTKRRKNHIPSKEDQQSILKKFISNPNHLACALKLLTPFERRCILFHFGYSTEHVTLSDWLKAQKISYTSFARGIVNAFEKLESYKPDRSNPCNGNMGDIIEEDKNYSIPKSVNRVVDAETSPIYKIYMKDQNGGFKPGDLTEFEYDLVKKVRSFVEKNSYFPTELEIAKMQNKNVNTIRGYLTELSKDFKNRYCTKEYELTRKNRKRVIDLVLQNDDLAKSHHLTPDDQDLLQALTTTSSGYYLTIDEVAEKLQRKRSTVITQTQRLVKKLTK